MILVMVFIKLEDAEEESYEPKEEYLISSYDDYKISGILTIQC